MSLFKEELWGNAKILIPGGGGSYWSREQEKARLCSSKLQRR